MTSVGRVASVLDLYRRGSAAAADSACAHCRLPVTYTAHSTDSIALMLGLPLRVKLHEQT